MTPIDPEKIQPAIRRLVRWLRQLDFETTDSGDGITNVQAGMEGAIPEPHVFCVVDPQYGCIEARRLFMECRMADFPIEKLRVEFSFSPLDEIGLVALFGITDADLPEHLPDPA